MCQASNDLTVGTTNSSATLTVLGEFNVHDSISTDIIF